MDLDGDLMFDAPRELRGFRRLWTASQASSPELSGPLAVESIGEHQNLPYDFDPGDAFLRNGGEELPQDVWDVISMPAEVTQAELRGVTGKLFFDSLDDAPHPALIQLLDPQKRESAWKVAAIEADLRKLRNSFTKLPWEQEGVGFKSADKSQGVALEAFDMRFAPVFIGAHDVLDSQVMQSRPISVSLQPDLPIVPISLQRASEEHLDGDIQRKALLRFRDLILQNPLATQLGTSLHGHVQQSGQDDEIDHSLREFFQDGVVSNAPETGCFNWAQLYVALCRMRDSGLGAATAGCVTVALHFWMPGQSLQLLICQKLCQRVAVEWQGTCT